MNDTAAPLYTLKELKDLLGDEWKKTLGNALLKLILATLIIGGVELTYGLPIVTLATSPLVACLLVFLWESRCMESNANSSRGSFQENAMTIASESWTKFLGANASTVIDINKTEVWNLNKERHA